MNSNKRQAEVRVSEPGDSRMWASIPAEIVEIDDTDKRLVASQILAKSPVGTEVRINWKGTYQGYYYS